MGIAINTNTASSEVAPESAWFKSSYSNDSGGACVEVADLAGEVGIRDSKDKGGSALVVPAGAWSWFVGAVSTHRLS
ncbi:DUF397 domain-containing protein [Streptomyces sp. NPDC058534]|uniref:DUF397 domain-containing protein n=1 Tax=Streptomyces sp. NPDC058534 TaxID=3346541 RepID=UPI0036646583